MRPPRSPCGWARPEKGQQVIADSLNLIPALKSVTPNWDNVELVNPAVQEEPVKALIEQASAVTDSPRFATINADMNVALQDALTKVADGTSTPEEATADLQRRTGVRRLTTLTTRPGGRRFVGTTSRTRNRLRPNGLPWILPAFVFVVGFLYYAVGYTGYISTLDWDGLSPIAESVGLGNYTEMWADPVFWAALRHTAVFWVGTFVGQTVLGFTFAAILHSGVKFPTLHKVIIFIPTVLAPATMAPGLPPVLRPRRDDQRHPSRRRARPASPDRGWPTPTPRWPSSCSSRSGSGPACSSSSTTRR